MWSANTLGFVLHNADNPYVNIVIVCDRANVNGGASKVAITSARALAEQGHNVFFFASFGPVCEELEGVNVTCLEQPPYNEGNPRRAILHGLWDRHAAMAFGELLSTLDPEETVVHAHSYRDALSASVPEIAIWRGFPVVLTAHEYGLACPYASFYNHQRQGPCGNQALSLGCLATHCNQKSYSRKLWTFAKGVIQNRWVHLPEQLSDVIFVSKFSQQILDSYIGPNVRRHLVRNPIATEPNPRCRLSLVSCPSNTKPVTRQPSPVRSESPFLFVGALVPGKNPLLAARAAAELKVPIRFVGDGELKEAIQEANPQAVVTGWLGTEEVREEMLAARALVFPARWYETQGMVVQEAAALGRPSIVSSKCAAAEAIENGVTGLLIEPEPEQLKTAMQTLSDYALCQSMGQAAFTCFWADPPTLDKHVSEITRIYEGALGRHREDQDLRASA